MVNSPRYSTIASISSCVSAARTLIELLCERAFRQPDRHGYVFLGADDGEESTLTYQELDRQARVIAVALHERGINDGRALLIYPPGLDFLAGFFGCLYAGIAAVPAYPPDPSRLDRTLPRLRAIARDAMPAVALTLSTVSKAGSPESAEPFTWNWLCARFLGSRPWLRCPQSWLQAQEDKHKPRG